MKRRIYDLFEGAILKTASLAPLNYQPISKKTIIFIAGVEGSGTTFLIKLLQTPENAFSITYHNYEDYLIPKATIKKRLCNYKHIYVMQTFQKTVENMWRFPYSEDQKTKDGQIKLLRGLKVPAYIDNVIIKRSYPSGYQGDIFPDISDLLLISKNVKVINLKRDLKENIASVLRRRFVKTIEEAIERIQNADRILNAQLKKVDSSRVLNIEYDQLIKNRQRELSAMERFLGYNSEELVKLQSLIRGGTKESKKVLDENIGHITKIMDQAG